MGMTIDNTCEPKPMSREEIVDTLKTMVFGVQAFERFNAKERETLDKAWNIIDQYENRLKADMVAMLTELQIEFDEKYWRDTQGYIIRRNGFNSGIEICVDIIQEKINSLKSEGE